jgi:hypothetical protein
LDSFGELRRVHTQLQLIAPFRDLGLVPEPAATPSQISRLEAALGFSLPPSYEQFLLRHNGWRRFFDGVHLLGTHELGHPDHVASARPLLNASLRTRDGAAPQLLPFGVESQMCSIFAFDVNCASAEKPVVAWVGELGIRAGNFPKFMELLAQISAAELHSSSHTGAVNLWPNIASSAA